MVAVIFVDTHVLLWVLAGDHDRLSPALARQLPSAHVRLSPMVVLEMQYLHEVGRVSEPAAPLMERLTRRLHVSVAETPLDRLVGYAVGLHWTRDPFDRLIVAGAMAEDLPLLTADRRILANCPLARWD